MNTCGYVRMAGLISGSSTRRIDSVAMIGFLC
jgi:hypothetical protein